MKTFSNLSRITVAIVVIATLSLVGCGGGSGFAPTSTPITIAPFTPVVHDGHVVYLLGGMYDSSYIAQDSADHFVVTPGAYRPVCLREDEVGTARVNTCGGVDWQAQITDIAGNTMSPTPNGWILGPGAYNGTIPNPEGGTIAFVITVIPGDLDGLTVRMVPVDLAGNRFQQDAEGHYQVPTFITFDWAQEWSKDGLVVSQTRFSAYATTINGNLDWVSYGYQSSVIQRCSFVVRVNDNDQNHPGGYGPVTVDTVTVEFYYRQ